MILQKLRSSSRRGFTLMEIAIVLAIIGIVSAGLWRLMSASSQQTKDQAAAQQMQSLMDAVRNYLNDAGTGGGQALLTSMAANASAVIPLPSGNWSTVAGCQTLQNDSFDVLCSYLPTGFNATTKNPYGQVYGASTTAAQNYGIRVKKDNTAAGTAPQSYSYMIITSGGSTITDVSGSTISGIIGGDGGFAYTSSAICGSAAPTVCGTMGAWSAAPVGDFGYASGAATAGRIAVRGFQSGSATGSLFWLARKVMPNDTTFQYNTMVTDLLMGTNATTTSTPTSIRLNAGSIEGTATSSTVYPILDLSATDASFISASNPHYLVQLAAACSNEYNSDCGGAALLITTGDLWLNNGQIKATKIYSSSDARFKTDIHPIPHPLDDVMKIDAVSFKFKDSGRDSLGVTAQNLEKVYPQLISETNDRKYVDYNGLIGPLLGAVQELKRQNDALREDLHRQDERVKTLEKQLTSHK